MVFFDVNLFIVFILLNIFCFLISCSTMEKTYILGHKNPDVDSICSAVAYANFKKAIGFENCIAGRCGNSNMRIDKVLSRFSTPLPEFVGDVRLRAKDIMKTEFVSLPSDSSCFAVMDAIDKYDLRSIPMVDENKKLCGEVSIFDMGEFFIPRASGKKAVRHLRATLNDVIKTLNAKAHLVFRPDETEDMYVRIGAMEVSTFGKFIETEDSRPEQNLIVVGDRFDIQIKAIQMGVRGIIITGDYDIDPSVIEMAKVKSVSIISCDYDSATTSLLVRMATRVEKLMRKDATIIPPDKLLSKISTRTKNLNKTIFVCSSDGVLRGVFSSVDLLDVPRAKLILVDHNEMSQSVLGACEADITEIVDHHRIGAVSTHNPILFVNKPVGSTCTIISQFFARAGIAPDSNTAGLMLSGIICDTLNLKGPTATNEDAEEIARLEKLAGVSADELSDYIFGSTSIISSISSDSVITTDCKHYHEDGVDFSISQIEELDFSSFYKNISDIRAALEKYRKANKLSFSALFITNVMTQDSLLMICGSSDVIEHIGYVKDADTDVFELPKIVSRKKQLVPYFMSILHSL